MSLPQNDFRFPKKMHLRKSCEFDRVFQEKISVADGNLVIYASLNGLPFPRLGLVVSRKFGKAHLRNRWKRIIRELFRLQQHQLSPSPTMTGIDFVVIARQRQRGVKPSTHALKISFHTLTERLLKKIMNGEVRKNA